MSVKQVSQWNKAGFELVTCSVLPSQHFSCSNATGPGFVEEELAATELVHIHQSRCIGGATMIFPQLKRLALALALFAGTAVPAFAA